MHETSCNDLKLTMKIEPPQMSVAVGETGQFRAYVTGTWQTGSQAGVVAFSHASIDPVWKSEAPEIADFIGHTGTILATKSNLDPIKITASASVSLPDTKDEAQVMVAGDYIEVRPPHANLCPGQDATFEVVLKNSAAEDLGQIVANWSSNHPLIANCSECFQIPLSRVTAGDVEGMATVTARNVAHNLSGTASVYVHKEIAKIHIASYQSGDAAYADGANLVGTIQECGTRRVKRIEVRTGTSIRSANVGEDGKFGLPIPFAVPLEWGVNHLVFLTYDQYGNSVPNNMAGIDFTLNHVPHCLASESTLQLPNPFYGTAVTWHSANPEIASVDVIGLGVVSPHANGWAKLYTEWQGLPVVRWVGVSSGTNYVYTHEDDPFYEPEPVRRPPPPALDQMLGQVSNWHVINSGDFTGKYWVGSYQTSQCNMCYYAGGDPLTCQGGGGQGIFCNLAGFLYDGTSLRSMQLTENYSNAYASMVNEVGEVIGGAYKDHYCECYVGYPSCDTYRTFLYKNGLMSFIEYPGACTTQVLDLNNNGKLLMFGRGNSAIGPQGGDPLGYGLYDTETHAFTSVPNGATQINDAGHILGLSGVPNDPTHSYVLWIYRDGAYETVAGPLENLWGDLHESGQVHITYGNTSNQRSVLLTRCTP